MTVKNTVTQRKEAPQPQPGQTSFGGVANVCTNAGTHPSGKVANTIGSSKK